MASRRWRGSNMTLLGAHRTLRHRAPCAACAAAWRIRKRRNGGEMAYQRNGGSSCENRRKYQPAVVASVMKRQWQ
jgi:hypothetical protein